MCAHYSVSNVQLQRVLFLRYSSRARYKVLNNNSNVQLDKALPVSLLELDTVGRLKYFKLRKMEF